MNQCDNDVEIVSLKQQSINNKSKTSITDKIKDIFSNSKIFKVKGLKLLVPLLVLVVLGVMILNSDWTSTTIDAKTETSGVSYTSSMAYITAIEEKLSKVLSTISGAGKTQIMISIDGSPVLSIASNVEEKTVTTSSGTTVTTTNEPIIITSNGQSSPLILSETLPEIKGVVVVSSGASDVKVKLDIINAVRTALNISSDKINVFMGV